MSETLEAYLHKKIFGENLPNDYSPSMTAVVYTIMASIGRSLSERASVKPRLEDFAIDSIPNSVKDNELMNYTREFYKSLGYDEFQLERLGPDINFRKEDKKIGVNLSYNPSIKTCLVTVLDTS